MGKSGTTPENPRTTNKTTPEQPNCLYASLCTSGKDTSDHNIIANSFHNHIGHKTRLHICSQNCEKKTDSHKIKKPSHPWLCISLYKKVEWDHAPFRTIQAFHNHQLYIKRLNINHKGSDTSLTTQFPPCLHIHKLRKPRASRSSKSIILLRAQKEGSHLLNPYNLWWSSQDHNENQGAKEV